jgi:hypothetical protein
MPQTLSDDGASFGFSANVSRRMRANHGANPKGSKEGAKHERRTDSISHPRDRVADFDLGTQQNMELRMTFHLRLKSTMNRGL